MKGYSIQAKKASLIGSVKVSSAKAEKSLFKMGNFTRLNIFY